MNLALKAKWRAMIARCYNPKNIGFPDYGGRGITVCEEWMESFERYVEDMGPKPGPGYSIDRIDNSKGYSKENCRWATLVEQANNKRNNRILSLDGVSMSLADWARHSGVDCEAISFRLKLGWDLHKAIFQPTAKAKSGVQSVSFRAARGTWVVRVKRGNRYINVGSYMTFFDAVCGRLGNEYKEKVTPDQRSRE